MTRGLIDIHQHLLPPDYMAEIDQRGIKSLGGLWWPKWSVEYTLEEMDKNGIQKSFVSLSEPGVYFNDQDWARRLSRLVNEYAARLVSEYPDRFGAFAFLPLPYVDDALKELEYALDTLKLSGVALLTNLDDKYLGDPEFDAVFAELNRRKAIVFVHPTSSTPAMASKLNVPPFVLDFPVNTSRAIINMMTSGTLERYRDSRYIFPHGGGVVPYLAKRLEYTRARTAGTPKYPQLAEGTPRGVAACLQDLYYDTALSYGPSTLALLQQFVGADHILYGSDWPFAERWLGEGVQAIGTYLGLNHNIRNAVERDNALSLLAYSIGKSASAAASAG